MDITEFINVDAGNAFQIYITPADGYQVSFVIVDGTQKGSITTYSFTNITANHTINAYFKVKTYSITASTGAGGTISPSGTATLNIGASQTYAIAPTPGYHILDVVVDGLSKGPVATYTFDSLSSDHTITATFAPNPAYTITASAGPNGSISPSGAVSVLGGTSRTFVISPAAGYRVADVIVDIDLRDGRIRRLRRRRCRWFLLRARENEQRRGNTDQ